jgi:hypothetical protein
VVPGKSTLVRQFAEASGLVLLEINFERNPEYLKAFASKDRFKFRPPCNCSPVKK